MGKFNKEEIIEHFKSLHLTERTPKEGNRISDLRNKYQPIHTFLFMLKGIDENEIDPVEFKKLIAEMRRDAIDMDEIFISLLHELDK
jgi:hypothetical protein